MKFMVWITAQIIRNHLRETGLHVLRSHRGLDLTTIRRISHVAISWEMNIDGRKRVRRCVWGAHCWCGPWCWWSYVWRWHLSWTLDTAADDPREHEYSLKPGWGSPFHCCALCLSTQCPFSAWQCAVSCGFTVHSCRKLNTSLFSRGCFDGSGCMLLHIVDLMYLKYLVDIF